MRFVCVNTSLQSTLHDAYHHPHPTHPTPKEARIAQLVKSIDCRFELYCRGVFFWCLSLQIASEYTTVKNNAGPNQWIIKITLRL